jgi:hypothetical protein
MRVAILLALILCCSVSHAEEVVEIPLSEVWALDMPGTKDLNKLLKKENGAIDRDARRWLRNARRSLMEKLPEEKAKIIFAVVGTGRTALEHASELFRDKSIAGIEPLASADDLSFVFYSYSSAYRVEIEKIERENNIFRIKYRFIPQKSVESAIQLALIPIGKLPVGHYPVELVQLPLEEEYLDAGFEPVGQEAASRIVCQPYTFQVYERPAPDPGPAKEAVVIPLDDIWAYNIPGTKNIQELDPDHNISLSIGSLGILQLIGKKKASPGYVVPGTGREALTVARKKLPPGEMPPNELPEGTDISLVYYSHGFSQHIVLHRVERLGNAINIRYRFDDKGNTGLSQHYALIPLGKLPEGKYQVNMIPVWDKLVEMSPSYYLNVADDVQRTVCQSFEFTITPAENE